MKNVKLVSLGKFKTGTGLGWGGRVRGGMGITCLSHAWIVWLNLIKSEMIENMKLQQ